MTEMTYVVSTVSRDEKGNLVLPPPIGTFTDKRAAMKAAKRVARTRRDCVKYGPTSIAYVGRELTAVVAW